VAVQVAAVKVELEGHTEKDEAARVEVLTARVEVIRAAAEEERVVVALVVGAMVAVAVVAAEAASAKAVIGGGDSAEMRVALWVAAMVVGLVMVTVEAVVAAAAMEAARGVAGVRGPLVVKAADRSAVARALAGEEWVVVAARARAGSETAVGGGMAQWSVRHIATWSYRWLR